MFVFVALKEIEGPKVAPASRTVLSSSFANNIIGSCSPVVLDVGQVHGSRRATVTVRVTRVAIGLDIEFGQVGAVATRENTIADGCPDIDRKTRDMGRIAHLNRSNDCTSATRRRK